MKKNSLKKDFALRKDFFTNRSSAVFPIFFRSKTNDLVLSWLNYWSIKNGVNHSNLAVNIRIYSHDGDLLVRAQIELEKENNSVSARSFLKTENSLPA